MDINIKALAKQIAIELKKRDAFVMSATDIALFFGFAPTSTSLRGFSPTQPFLSRLR